MGGEIVFIAGGAGTLRSAVTKIHMQILAVVVVGGLNT